MVTMIVLVSCFVDGARTMSNGIRREMLASASKIFFDEVFEIVDVSSELRSNRNRVDDNTGHSICILRDGGGRKERIPKRGSVATRPFMHSEVSV